MDEKPDINPHFFHLIMSHEAAAMQFMGKLAGADGKVEKNLEMARYAIDTLEALRDKTKGNLSDEEKQLLDHSLYQLHMNFVDEGKAEKKAAEQTPSETAGDEKPDSDDKKQADDQPEGQAEKPAAE
jgi:hypothetical protein